MPRPDPVPTRLAMPRLSLDIGITGHRTHHPVFSAKSDAIAVCLDALMTTLAQIAGEEAQSVDAAVPPRVRLYSLLAYGADLLAVRSALAKGWPVVAPLPFGRALNLAINAQPSSVEDMGALLAGDAASDEAVATRARDIQSVSGEVSLFELAEQDEAAEALFHGHLISPENNAARQAFEALCSDRAAMAGRVMIEQSDVVIGIWDGETHGAIGGTRHTIEAALDQGIPVIWIDARNPSGWNILHASEDLAVLSQRTAQGADLVRLRALVRNALVPSGEGWRAASQAETWRSKSQPLLHAYRRIETLFGEPGRRPFRNLVQRYEPPDAIPTGSAAPLLAAASSLPGMDPAITERLASDVLQTFGWADGVSTWLSDAYRGSMVASFFLSAFAIVGGITYLPFASIDQKWAFAAFECVLLAAIIGIFFTGKRLRWHERWFETRRVAEYFRHAPILLLLGAARSTGRWPRGADGNWPEWYARHALCAFGLPRMTVTPAFLRRALALMRDHHVVPQRDYHAQKSRRLHTAQHNLDRLSELLFVLAVLSVTAYLLIVAGARWGWLDAGLPHDTAKLFTFLGVLFPTMGGAFAGVHYFGDFERFSAISEITSSKLNDITTRIEILLSAPDTEITYARVSALAHAIDDVVVAEIESWQAVFGGKHITVPV